MISVLTICCSIASSSGRGARRWSSPYSVSLCSPWLTATCNRSGRDRRLTSPGGDEPTKVATRKRVPWHFSARPLPGGCNRRLPDRCPLRGGSVRPHSRQNPPTPNCLRVLLVLAVVDDLHRACLAGIAVGREGEGAGGPGHDGHILEPGQGVAQRVAIARGVGQFGRVGDDVDGVVGLRRELVGRLAVGGFVGFDEGHVLRRLAVGKPGRALDGVLGRLAVLLR